MPAFSRLEQVALHVQPAARNCAILVYAVMVDSVYPYPPHTPHSPIPQLIQSDRTSTVNQTFTDHYVVKHFVILVDTGVFCFVFHLFLLAGHFVI